MHELTPADRGIHYGDGLFETIAVRGGRPVRLERHLARLSVGCKRLGFEAPDLSDEILAFTAGTESAVLKVIVTRGQGGRGYRPPVAATPTRLLSLHPWPEYPSTWSEQGIAVRWCDTRLAIQPALAGLKHLNRLEQVLARNEWRDDDAWQEGLMCDTAGNIIEGTQSNLFVVHQGALFTPSLDDCGVAGIMRGMLLEAAQSLGIACKTEALSRAAIERADEMFVCNSIAGIWPVRRVATLDLPTTRPITTRLQRWLHDRGDA